MAENGSNGNGNGVGRWQWILSILTALAIVAGAALSFFVQNASLSTQVSIDSQRIVALEQQLQATNERASATRADVSAMRSDLREVETQFCSSDIVRNLMHAYDLRLIAMLWHKVNPDQLFPTDNSYYPHICNRQAAVGSSS